MRRRALLGASAATMAVPPRVEANPMPIIGILALNQPTSAHLLAAFNQGMAESGYVEGKNFTTETQRDQSFSEAAADFVRRNVNVIFAGNPGALSAAVKATTSMPVVGIDLENDPVAQGYVGSISRPGGNVTGMFLDIPQLCGKQLSLMKEINPGLTRVAVIGISGYNAPQFAAAAAAAVKIGVATEFLEVMTDDDLPGALDKARMRTVDAGILLSSPFTLRISKLISEIALAKRLPIISLFAEFPRKGGLMAYGPNLGDMYRRCGQYVGKILHGAKPGDLPLQRPEIFELIINVKTAQSIGVVFPPTLFASADEVIE